MEWQTVYITVLLMVSYNRNNIQPAISQDLDHHLGIHICSCQQADDTHRLHSEAMVQCVKKFLPLKLI
jgi:hypothetical protein